MKYSHLQSRNSERTANMVFIRDDRGGGGEDERKVASHRMFVQRQKSPYDYLQANDGHVSSVLHPKTKSYISVVCCIEPKQCQAEGVLA